MTFYEDLNRRVKSLSYFDMKLIGWSGIILGLILAKLFPPLTEISWPWLIILVLVLLIKPTYVFTTARRT